MHFSLLQALVRLWSCLARASRCPSPCIVNMQCGLQACGHGLMNGRLLHSAMQCMKPRATLSNPVHTGVQVLAVLPGAVKNPIKKAIGKAVEMGEKGVSATAGRVANTLVTTRCREVALLARVLHQTHT